jgi:hypothetical protein
MEPPALFSRTFESETFIRLFKCRINKSGGGACNGLLLLSQKINRLAQARTPRKELTKFNPSPLSAFQSDHFSVFSQSCN